jgi:DNA polymerase III alpha subunit
MRGIPDGKAYYEYVIANVDIDPSNPNNSYIMWAAGKVADLDQTKPTVYVKEASALPDIDIDFAPSYREQSIQYVKNKYGEDQVSQVVTFSRLQGRSAIKAVMRSEGIHSFDIMNDATKNFPASDSEISDQLANMDEPSIIRWMLEDNAEGIKDYCYLDSDGELAGDLKEVFRKALKLEGTYQSQGRHAAGVIIASEPVSKYAPMVLASKSAIRVCGFEMKAAEKAGLVKFDFLGNEILEKIQKVLGNDLSHIPLNDQDVWDYLSEGNVKGCFQIETQSKWTKELKPKSIEEISALVAIIRPGMLQSKHKSGINMTKHYCNLNSGVDVVDKDYVLHDILKDTHNCIIYQESILEICKEIAGFSGPARIKMMKSVGKKDAKLMKKLKKEFLDGCKKEGKVSEEEAKYIFDQIKKSARYLFNLSHSLSYSFYTYYSAYCKVHHTLKFYETWLAHAEGKQKPHVEIYYLVNSAKLDGVPINPPSIQYGEHDFFIRGKSVHFGLRAIKGVGDKELEKLFKICGELREKPEYVSWNQILYRLDEINKRSVTALIESGALDYMGVSRGSMLHQYTRIKELTKKEMEFVKNKAKACPDPDGISLEDMFIALIPTKKEGGGTSNVKRSNKVKEILTTLKNPGRSLEDTPSYVATVEEKLMGVALSSSHLEECIDACAADTTCKEFIEGKGGDKVKMTISLTFMEVKEHKILKEGPNKGRKMAFIRGCDDTCELENIVIFPEAYKEYGDIIIEGNMAIVLGERSGDSFRIDKAYQL